MRSSGVSSIKVLNLPDLRGISIENYKAKLERRATKRAKGRNQMAEISLNTTLRLEARTFTVLEKTIKVEEEHVGRRLLDIQMAKNEFNPPKTPQATRLLRKEKDKQEVRLQKRDERRLSNRVEENVLNYVAARWYRNQDDTDRRGPFLGELSRNIPLTMKQQLFLAKIQGLTVPVEEKNEKKKLKAHNPEKRGSRLFVPLPMQMDGSAVGAQYRRESTEIGDAPLLYLRSSALMDAKKEDAMHTWVGLDKEEDLDHVLAATKEEIQPDYRRRIEKVIFDPANPNKLTSDSFLTEHRAPSADRRRQPSPQPPQQNQDVPQVVISATD